MTDDKVIGRRCVVYFELGPCFFRKGKKVKSAGGYFLGKVVARRGKNKLTVRFDDSEESDFVHNEVLFVEPSTKNQNRLVLCNDPEKCVATLEPGNVVPGDLVEANYDGSSWFRGRVAFVDTSHGTCDVAYDDGDYQSGVNIQKHLILLSKGVEDPTWLAGLPVSISNASGQSRKGKIADTIEKKSRIMVAYQDGKTKAFSYFSIASAIFLNARTQPGRKILPWPSPRVVSPPKSKPGVLSDMLVNQQKPPGKDVTKKPSEKRTQGKEELSKAKTKPSLKHSQKEEAEARSPIASQSGESPLGIRSVRSSQKKVSYAEYDSDVGVDETDLIEYNPSVKNAGERKTRKASPQKTTSYAECDSDASVDETDLIEYNPPAKNADARKTRKASPQKSTTYAECDSDVDVDETDLIEYNPPTKSAGERKTRKTSPQKSTTYAECDSDVDVDETDLIEYNPPTKNAGERKTRKSTPQKSTTYAECDSDVDVDETDLVEYNPPAKNDGERKTRKTSPQKSTTYAECDSDVDVDETDLIEYNPPAKNTDARKKRKASPDKYSTRKRASKSDCGEAFDGNDSETAGKVDGQRSLRASTSSRSAFRNDGSQTAKVEDKEQNQKKPARKISRNQNLAIKLGPSREPTYFNIASAVVEMGESESEVYLSSLDSSESYVGKSFLTVMCMFHKRVPSAYHCKRLVDLLTFGPGKMSRNYFPDHNRMENALQMFRLLVVQHGLADHIASDLAPDYLEQVMKQASALYYTIEGDERRCTSAALHRLGLTLHARACGMEVFEVLVKHQLRGCLGIKPHDDRYRRRPLVYQMLNYPPLGTKGALEQMAKVYVKFWTQYSLFINGCFRCPPEESNPRLLEEQFDFVRVQASRVATSMGRALSYFCCLYGADMNESLESIGYLLGNIFKKEFENTKFATNDIVSDEAPLISLQGKVAMIVHLDETIIPDVLSKLAETLDVVDKFNTIYALLEN